MWIVKSGSEMTTYHALHTQMGRGGARVVRREPGGIDQGGGGTKRDGGSREGDLRRGL